MSYDIGFDVPGEPGEECVGYGWNPTYNMGSIFREAIGGDGMHGLNGVWVLEAKERLTRAAAKMRELGLAHFRQLEPSNGWGDAEGALWVIEQIRDACDAQHPWARLYVR